MNDKERKRWVADEVKEAVADRFKKMPDVTVIDISALEISIVWRSGISGKAPKYYRIKVSEAY